LGFSIISCSTTEGDSSETVSTNELVSVKLGFKANKQLTGKNVKRGVLPEAMDYIIVQTYTEGYTQSDQTRFDLTNLESIDGKDVTSDFEIDNLKSGSTRFDVSAYSNKQPLNVLFASKGDVLTKMDSLNNIMPIIPRYSAYLSRTLVAGVNPLIEFILTPKFGRIISLFKLSDELKSKNYTAIIKKSANTTDEKSITLSNNEIVSLSIMAFQDAVAPTYTIIYVDIFDENNIKVSTMEVKVVQIAGASVNTIYTITSDNIPPKVQGISVFQAPVFEKGEIMTKNL